MFWPVFRFELIQRLKSVGVWLGFIAIAYFTYQNLASSYFDDLIGTGKVGRNSAYCAHFSSVFTTFWTILFAPFQFGSPLLRDLQNRTARLIYATPVTGPGYYWGKFLASLLVMNVIALASAAMFLALPLIGVGREAHYIPTPWGPFLQSYLLFVVGGTITFGALQTALAARTGRLSWGYGVTVLAIFFFVFVSSATDKGTFDGNSPQGRLLRTVDILGLSTVINQVNYWSVAERNSGFLALNSELVLNRLLALGIPLLLAGLAGLRFDVRRLLNITDAAEERKKQRLERQLKKDSDENPPAVPQLPVLPEIGGLWWTQQTLRGGWREFTLLARGMVFWLLSGFFWLAAFVHANDVEGVPNPPEGKLLPLLQVGLPNVSQLFYLMILFCAIYFSGEILDRERASRTDKIIGATPVPDAALMGSKVLGISLLTLYFVLVPVVGVLSAMALSGLPLFDGEILLEHLLNVLPCNLAYTWMAIAVYGLTRSKVAAISLPFAVFIFTLMANELGLVEHKLGLYGFPHKSHYSGFAISGQITEMLWHFAVLWSGLAGVLLLLALWLWPRGSDTRLALRLGTLPQRVNLATGIAAPLLLAIALIAGNRIYRISIVENRFQTRDAKKAEAAAYEQKYGPLRSLPQPKITRAILDFKLQPEKRSAEIQATLVLINPGSAPITDLHLEFPEFAEVKELRWSEQPLQATTEDRTLRHTLYRLPAPLAPGGTGTLRLHQVISYRGFVDDGFQGTIVPDGTLVGVEMLPRFGYDRTRELELPGDRRRFALGTRVKLPPKALPGLHYSLAATDDADRVDWEATVTAPAGQTVVGPGERSGEADGVVRFRGSGMLWDLRFACAKYRVARSEAQGVSIEVYSHPAHTFNAQRFADSAAFALERLTQTVGPYPYRSLSIAEIPEGLADQEGHYHGTPHSELVSGNLLLIPEKRGFLHDYRSPNPSAEAMDWIQYLVAREVSRAWWGQKAAPAAVQGYSLITDAVPAALGLEILEARRGIPSARQYVAVQSDRYLKEGAASAEQEAPLTAGEDEEYLLHKGGPALLAVRRLLGPETYTSALRSFLENQPDKPTGHQLAEALISSSPLENRAAVAELLQQAVVYDFSIRPLDYRNGKLRVEVSGKRFAATDRDNREEAPFTGTVDIAVWTNTAAPYLPEKAATVQRISLTNGTRILELPLSGKPAFVEIDPFRQFFDRTRTDNTSPVN